MQCLLQLFQFEKTPLHYAAEKGKDQTCKVLLEAGASVDIQDRVSLPVPSGFVEFWDFCWSFVIQSFNITTLKNTSGSKLLLFWDLPKQLLELVAFDLRELKKYTHAHGGYREKSSYTHKMAEGIGRRCVGGSRHMVDWWDRRNVALFHAIEKCYFIFVLYLHTSFVRVKHLAMQTCFSHLPDTMGPVGIRHSSHDFQWQSSHSVDLAGWQAKMASIEIWILWRNAHKPHISIVSAF